MAEAIVLTSSRPTPADGQSFQRGEGFDRLGYWCLDIRREAWGTPRIVSVCLNLEKEKSHVVSCYVPTRSTRRVDKDKFFDDLNAILSSILSDEKYVLKGDFNFHVGSREVYGEQ